MRATQFYAVEEDSQRFKGREKDEQIHDEGDSCWAKLNFNRKEREERKGFLEYYLCALRVLCG